MRAGTEFGEYERLEVRCLSSIGQKINLSADRAIVFRFSKLSGGVVDYIDRYKYTR